MLSNKTHKWMISQSLRWNLPATKHNNRTVIGCQLPLQLNDHDTVVSQGLLHCQQADLRNVEGVFAKWQRSAIVSLEEERGGQWISFSVLQYTVYAAEMRKWIKLFLFDIIRHEGFSSHVLADCLVIGLSTFVIWGFGLVCSITRDIPLNQQNNGVILTYARNTLFLFKCLVVQIKLPWMDRD